MSRTFTRTARPTRPAYDCRPGPVSSRHWRPFCSERCKLLDLGNWVDGQYRSGWSGHDRPERTADHLTPADSAVGTRRIIERRVSAGHDCLTLSNTAWLTRWAINGQPHGDAQYEISGHRRHDPMPWICGRSRSTRTILASCSNDPAFLNTASCEERDHLHRRTQGHPAISGIPDRTAGQAEYVSSRSAYLLLEWQACRPRPSWPTWRARTLSRARDPARERQEVHEGFRYDAHPMGIFLCSRASAPSRRSTPRPRRSTTRPLGTVRPCDSLRRSRRASPPTPASGTAWASHTSIRTASSATPATS